MTRGGKVGLLVRRMSSKCLSREAVDDDVCHQHENETPSLPSSPRQQGRRVNRLLCEFGGSKRGFEKCEDEDGKDIQMRQQQPQQKPAPSSKHFSVRLLCRSKTIQDDVIITPDNIVKDSSLPSDAKVPLSFSQAQASSCRSRDTSSASSLDDDDDDDDDDEDDIDVPFLRDEMVLGEPQLDDGPIAVQTTAATATPPKKQARFVDEIGQSIAQVQVIDKVQTNDLMILLLLPSLRRFELLQVSYDEEDQVYAKDIVAQFPAIATDKMLAKQQYEGLARRRHLAGTGVLFAEQLSDDVSIQDYKLIKNEVLVATLEGYTADELMFMAAKLLDHKQVRKAVRRGKNSRRAVQQLDSRELLQNKQQKNGKRRKGKSKSTKNLVLREMLMSST